MQRRPPLPEGRPALSRCTHRSFDEFATAYWGREPLLESGLGPYDDLLDEPAVDELVSRRGLRTPFIRLAKDGTVVPSTRYTGPGGAGAEIADQVDPDRVLALVADGATLVLQALHRTWPPVVDHAGRLAAELGHPVQVNAYITPPQSRGFAAHYDVHDVFVLQTVGRKRWQLHRPVHPLPLRGQPWEQRRTQVAARAAEPPYLDAVLEPGDSLYLPRGWLHSAQALGGVSIHLTYGIHAITRHAMALALLDVAADDVALREALPLGLDVEDDAALRPHLDAVVDTLTRRLAGADLDDVRTAVRSRVARGSRPRPVSPLAQAAAARSLGPHDVVRWRPLLPQVVEPAGDGSYRIEVGTRSVLLPASAGPVLDRLADGGPVRVADLPLPVEDALDLVRRLLREAVLVPADVPVDPPA